MNVEYLLSFSFTNFFGDILSSFRFLFINILFYNRQKSSLNITNKNDIL